MTSLLALVAWQRWAVSDVGNHAVRPQPPGRTNALESLHVAEENPVHALTHTAGPIDADEIRQHLQALSADDPCSESGQLLLRRWVALRPLDATRWVEALSDEATRRQLLPVAALAWSELDLPAALMWARSITDDAMRHRLIADLGVELARADPVGALDLASLLPSGRARDEVELHAVRQWASADATAAAAWAAGQPAGTKREQALAATALAMAELNAPAAAQLLATSMQPGPELHRAAIGIVQRWANSDRRSARQWAEQFPAGALRDTALALIAEKTFGTN